MLGVSLLEVCLLSTRGVGVGGSSVVASGLAVVEGSSEMAVRSFCDFWIVE